MTAPRGYLPRTVAPPTPADLAKAFEQVEREARAWGRWRPVTVGATTSRYVAAPFDLLIVTPASGGTAVLLPDAAPAARTFLMVRQDSAGTVTVSCSVAAQTVDGGASKTLTVSDTWLFWSDGYAWRGMRWQYASGGGGGVAVSGGTSSQSTGTVVFSNSNGITFGLNAGTMTASVAGAAAGSLSAGTASLALGLAVLSNSNNVSFGLNGSTVTASASYSQSTAPAAISAGTTLGSSGTVVLSNSNGITFGMNGNTVTASHNGLTSQSTAPAAISAGTTLASNGTVVFSNANGVSFGVNGSTVTASVVAGGGGYSAGMSNIGNTSGTSGTVGSQLVLAGGNNITLSQSVNGASATVTISAGAGGAGVTVNSTNFEPGHGTGTASYSMQTNTSGAMTLVPFDCAGNVAAEYFGIIASMSFAAGGASSFRQSGTLAWGLYTRPTGTASTQLHLSGSSNLEYYVTYNNSSITLQHATASNASGTYGTNTTASAGLNISSAYTGLKLMALGLNSTLTQGRYWLGLHHRNSSSSFNSGLRLSVYGVANSLTGLAPWGSYSSAQTSGTNLPLGLGGRFMGVGGSYTVAGMTALTGSVTISQISANVTVIPYMQAFSRVT